MNCFEIYHTKCMEDVSSIKSQEDRYKVSSLLCSKLIDAYTYHLEILSHKDSQIP